MKLPDQRGLRALMQPLTPGVLGSKRYDAELQDYRFFSGATAIPLMSSEFVKAARFYPIIFVGEDLMPAAAMGIQNSANVFVDPATGEFQPGAYVPAFLRRWPFELDGDNILADLEAPNLIEGRGDALFDGEAPTVTHRKVEDFLREYHAEADATRNLVALLREMELLETCSAKINLSGGDAPATTVATFEAVAKARFDALDADSLVRLQKANAMEPIFAHLASSHLWWTLISRTARQTKAANNSI